MDDQSNPEIRKESFLESLLGFLNEVFSSEWNAIPGVKYLSPNMRREIHYSTIKVL